MNYNISKIREEYHLKGLTEAEVDANPLKQFSVWFEEVLESGIHEANAMLLGTVENDRPSARIVLLKGLDEKGFAFFTNYESRKGRQIAANPQVSLTFFWKELERQVRIEGRAEKTSEAESAEYFASRPRGSQLGAWVSSQSSAIAGREVLERLETETEKRFAGQEVPKPPYWGGYRVIPDYLEFWQGRPSRLHDRLAYTLQPNSSWKIERLSP